MREILIDKMSGVSQDIESSVMMWNKRAAEFAKNLTPNREDSFMNFVDKFVDVKGQRILDIGCGAGKYMQLLMERGAVAEGLDPSDQMILYAKEYLDKNGYSCESITFHNIAFQHFESDEKYDYLFISNNPILSYYESYEKMLKLAKKGIFISSWINMEDLLFQKVALQMGVDARFRSGKSIAYLFQLFFEDGYPIMFESDFKEYQKKVDVDYLCQRYTSWIYKEAYTQENVEEVREKILSHEKDGVIMADIRSSQGMLYVDISKRI